MSEARLATRDDLARALIQIQDEHRADWIENDVEGMGRLIPSGDLAVAIWQALPEPPSDGLRAALERLVDLEALYGPDDEEWDAAWEQARAALAVPAESQDDADARQLIRDWDFEMDPRADGPGRIADPAQREAAADTFADHLETLTRLRPEERAFLEGWRGR